GVRCELQVAIRLLVHREPGGGGVRTESRKEHGRLSRGVLNGGCALRVDLNRAAHSGPGVLERFELGELYLIRVQLERQASGVELAGRRGYEVGGELRMSRARSYFERRDIDRLLRIIDVALDQVEVFVISGIGEADVGIRVRVVQRARKLCDG